MVINVNVLSSVCVTDGQLVTWCDDCELRQPARSAHCVICDVCVCGRDHHCLWYICLYILMLTKLYDKLGSCDSGSPLRILFNVNINNDGKELQN